MDIKYAYYNTSKGYRVLGGTAAQFLKADGSIDSKEYIDKYSEQNIEGDKWFRSAGGNQYLNHRLRIISEDGSNPGLVFYKSGVNVGTIQYNGVNYLFTNSDTNAFSNLVSAGYIKEGSNNNFLLLGGGGHVPITEFTINSDLNTQLSFYHKRDSTGALNNASDTHTNQTWFDYNYAGTGFMGSVANFSGFSGSYSTELFASFNNPHKIAIRSKNGDTGTWNEPNWLWHDKNFNPANYATVVDVSNKIPYTGATQNPDFNGKNLTNINRLVTNGSIKHNGLGLSLVNISGSGDYNSVLIKTGITSGNMGTFTVKLYTYAHEYFEFNVNNYKYNNSNYATNITWKAGNSNAITRIEFLKDSNNILYVNVVIYMAYPRLAITDLMVYGWDDEPFDSINWGAEWNGDISGLINEGQALPANFLRDDYFTNSLNNYVKRSGDTMTGALNINSGGGIGRWKGYDNNTNYLTWRNYLDTKDIAYIGADGNSASGGGIGDGFSIVAPAGLLRLIGTDGVLINGYTPWTYGNLEPVTKNTAQQITGKKEFVGATDNSYTGAGIMINGNGNANTVYPTLAFHQPTLYAGTISYRENGFYFTNITGDVFDYVRSAGYIKDGSNNSYILLGGGGHKAISDFATSASLNNYLPLSGGTLSGGGRINSYGSIIVQQSNIGVNATGMGWESIDNTQNIAGIGILTQDGIFGQAYIGWGDTPWSGSTSLAVADHLFTYKNNQVWHAGIFNPNDKVNKSGDTMTGNLTVPNLVLSSNSFLSQTLNGSQVLSAAGDTMYLGNAAGLQYINFETGGNDLKHYRTDLGYGKIWDAHNFNPDLKVNKSGDTMTGGLIVNSTDSIGSNNLGALPQNTKLFLANGNTLVANYGTVFWTESTGQGFIQQQRADGQQTAYRLNLQPYSGQLFYGNNEVATVNQFQNYYTQGQSLNLFVGLNGVQTIYDTKTFNSSPVIPNGTLGNHAVNLNQLNNKVTNIDSVKGVAFDSGLPTGVPYFIHTNGTYIPIATQSWVSSNYISTSHIANTITLTNIQQWNYMAQYGLQLNSDFTVNTGSGLLIADDYFGGESGMIDRSYDRFVSAKQEGYYKYGSRYGTFDGLNFNFESRLFGMGRESNKEDKLTVEGSVKASKNFKSEEERPDTIFIPNGNVASLKDEIVNDESEYAIRLDPHEYEIDPSGYLDVDDRNRLIHIIGEQVKMVVNFKEIYPKQQIVIYNFDKSGGAMTVKIYGKDIYNIEPGSFLRLYVTRSRRVIAERQLPCEFVW